MNRLRIVLVATLLGTSACVRARLGPAEQEREHALDAVLTTADLPAEGGVQPNPDRGIGVVSFRVGPGSRPGMVDTLTLRSRPQSGAEAVAWYLLDHGDGNSYRYGVASRSVIAQANGVEYDYEVEGLPFQRLSNGWAEVIYGYGPDAAPRTGWVRLDPAHVYHHLWRDFLLEDVMLSPPVHPAFMDAPGGAAVVLPVAEYDLRALGARGEWMQVEIVAPPICTGDGEPVPMDTLWIRYLDETGRPLLWFFSRGC